MTTTVDKPTPDTVAAALRARYVDRPVSLAYTLIDMVVRGDAFTLHLCGLSFYYSRESLIIKD